MTGKSWSLRRRLIAWLLIPLSLLCAVMLTSAYFSAIKTADKAYDRLLSASAMTIADRVIVEDGELEVDLPYVALEMFSSTAQDRVFYQVSGLDGEIITGYRDLPAVPSEGSGTPAIFDAEYRGFTVRVVVLTKPIHVNGVKGQFTVKVAQTKGERNRLVNDLMVGATIRLVLLLVLATAFTWMGITLGLAPLKRLQVAIRMRSSQDLSPLETDVPREVLDLVMAINGLMTRIGGSFTSMRRFIADASHQLRTPLATLKLQAEVALREQEPDVIKGMVAELHENTRRTSRLVEQLLTLTRIEPDNGVHRLESVDLADLAAEMTRSLVPAALRKKIDLGFERDSDGASVTGDPVFLGEMLNNVIENAIMYCPSGSRVTVRVCKADDSIHLEVVDDGPGIPPDEREKVLDRFYRLPGAPAGGCGLGLSIVKEIAERHGGRVALLNGNNGTGLRVMIELPREGDRIMHLSPE